jgi:transglutaminase-like putative cysteine protease
LMTERLKEYESTMTYDDFVTHIAVVLEQLYEFLQARPELARSWAEIAWLAFHSVKNEESREDRLVGINTRFWKLMYKAVHGIDQDHVVE